MYVLFDSDGIPRYIGKGKGERFKVHERDKNSSNRMKNHFIKRTLEALGEIPKLKIHENLYEDVALEYEIVLIKAIGRQPKGPLVNMTDGGDGISGFSMPEHAKEKQRDAASKFRHSEETKKLLSKLKKGKPVHRNMVEGLNRWRSKPENREKFSEKKRLAALKASSIAAENRRKGRPNTEAEIRRNESRKGILIPGQIESLQRAVEAAAMKRRGMKLDQEWRDKISKANMGRTMSEKNRKAVSDAQRKRWEIFRSDRNKSSLQTAQEESIPLRESVKGGT